MVVALSVGLGILVVSLLLFAMTTALIVQLVVWFIRSGYTALGFWPHPRAIKVRNALASPPGPVSAKPPMAFSVNVSLPLA
jgi:uncharacterized membrane protein YdbT with pleckstrin-like domain